MKTTQNHPKLPKKWGIWRSHYCVLIISTSTTPYFFLFDAKKRLIRVSILINIVGVIFMWILFGITVSGSILGYAVLSSAVDKKYSGRALSLLNLLATVSGFIIQYLVGYLEDSFMYGYGYRLALMSLIVIQSMAIFWAIYNSRKTAKKGSIK